MSKRVAVIIVAAGSSSRMGGDVPKVYRMLEGKMVLKHSLETFKAHSAVSDVLIVVNPEHEMHYAELKEQGIWFVRGGETRQESVYNGLDALADTPPDWVLVHDAARPNIDSETIDRVLAALEASPGAIPCVRVKDTIRHQAEGTLERSALRAVQTPQGFHYPELLAAHMAAHGKEYTDDAAVMEAAGLPVALVEGDETNTKLTVPEDWPRAAGDAQMCVGQGYDVHRLINDEARPLMICGVEVPSELALDGHSDADVGLHALVDALLGAMGEGDIGEHFPPSDSRWKNTDSSEFVREVMRILKDKGGRVINVDITLIAQAPKMSDYKHEMRVRTAALLEVEQVHVNIKATTTEGLGFIGRKEGIAAQAVVCVKC